MPSDASPEGSLPFSTRLPAAPPASTRLMILDTNIMQHAITSPGGAVIHRLNSDIEKARIAEAPETGFCSTPFQIIEVLGTNLPDIRVTTKPVKGQSTRQRLNQLVNDARAAYAALPELSQERLAARAVERRSYLPEEAHDLFDICITKTCEQADLREQIASVLAWDYALKMVVPKASAKAIDPDLMALLLVPGVSHVSRFRIAKRMWDLIYARAHREIPPALAGSMNAAHKAMQLKLRRDFLDCDLYHLACFGYFGADVTVFTGDPPDSIMHRISVYKGMVEAAAASATDIPDHKLPQLHAGIVARCEPSGEISHIFPVHSVPTMV